MIANMSRLSNITSPENCWDVLIWVTGHCNRAAVSRNRYSVEKTVDTHIFLFIHIHLTLRKWCYTRLQHDFPLDPLISSFYTYNLSKDLRHKHKKGLKCENSQMIVMYGHLNSGHGYLLLRTIGK
jgi:hypothetical protein